MGGFSPPPGPPGGPRVFPRRGKNFWSAGREKRGGFFLGKPEMPGEESEMGGRPFRRVRIQRSLRFLKGRQFRLARESGPACTVHGSTSGLVRRVNWDPAGATSCTSRHRRRCSPARRRTRGVHAAGDRHELHAALSNPAAHGAGRSSCAATPSRSEQPWRTSWLGQWGARAVAVARGDTGRPLPTTPPLGRNRFGATRGQPALVPTCARWLCGWQGRLVAHTRRAIRVLETAHPTMFLPALGRCRPDLLAQAQGTSFWRWKGAACYWSLVHAGRRLERVAWSYPEPLAGAEALAGPLPSMCRATGLPVGGQASDTPARWALRWLDQPGPGRPVQGRTGGG